MSQSEPGGNTKTPGSYKNFQHYCWAFTWPQCYQSGEEEVEVEPSQLSQLLKVWCKAFTYQLEKAPVTGYMHYQGFMSLKVKEYLNTVKTIVGANVHLEPVKNPFAAKIYAMKIESRIEGPWNETSIFLRIIKVLRPWQAKAEKLCVDHDLEDRFIHWFYDPEGCNGKTVFCKYMAVKHKATILGNGAFADIAMAIPEAPKIVLMNLTRSIEGRVNYSAIEAIKDGMIFNSKYESGIKLFNPPIVCVFSNFKPKFDTMTKDRFKLHTEF